MKYSCRYIIVTHVMSVICFMLSAYTIISLETKMPSDDIVFLGGAHRPSRIANCYKILFTRNDWTRPIALWWISIIIHIMFSIDLGLRQWSWSNIIGSAVTYMYLHVVKALNPANPSTRRRVGTRQRASKEAYLPARCFLRDFVYRQPVEGDIKPKSRLHWQYTVHLAKFAEW